ncbi:late sexual development protein [Pseudomassariella vexata]|uniref:Late sexual development protein n=1 Tax=Pseudomassariella vexata TaxID=1141098 RepID=A0A1Y2DNR3_9PEZI|nr:late sexual development protein [Pseudomassariella vexata]ORY60933.1 late sexual development protein [Pseudomassariella vexata]
MLTYPVACAAAVFSLAAGYAIPNHDGFPSPDDQQLLDIQTEADGKLPNAPPPGKLSVAGITNFQLVAFNEQFEVAFFTSLIENVTNRDGEFSAEAANRDEAEILQILKTIKAQEELHAITAINQLKQFNASLIPQPCNYKFPTTSLDDALNLASTFTSVVLGTLQDAQQSFAKNGDDAVVRVVSSVVGQEGEQNGFLRFMLHRRPSSKPFLTTSIAPYAYSALQAFIVSCPFKVEDIPIPIFPALNVLTNAEARDMTLSYSADLKSYIAGLPPSPMSPMFITYIVGQQLPISVRIRNQRLDGTTLIFDADFPFTANVMQGLTIAALTNSSDFKEVGVMAASTLAAPGLIQVNDLLRPGKIVSGGFGGANRTRTEQEP